LSRVLLFLLIIVLNANSSWSQSESPYNFNWKRDLIYASGAGLLTAGGFLADFQTRPLTPAQINSLDEFDLPGFDRATIRNWNPDAALASDILLYGSVTLPAFIMINKRARKDFLVVGFIYAETALLTLGITELTKGLVKRPRPYVYNPDLEMSRKTERDARFSFISGHTSLTAALCFTTAKVFSDYSDNPTHEALVWTAAAVLPLTTAALRVEAGKHFPSDVIAGYFVGGAIGYLVPWLHRRKPVAKGVTLSPMGVKGGAGVYFSYRFQK
jgi:membrane-associated phospholipid phosphatase